MKLTSKQRHFALVAIMQKITRDNWAKYKGKVPNLEFRAKKVFNDAIKIATTKSGLDLKMFVEVLEGFDSRI